MILLYFNNNFEYILLNTNVSYSRNYVSGHFEPQIRIPDIIYLLEALAVYAVYVWKDDISCFFFASTEALATA